MNASPPMIDEEWGCEHCQVDQVTNRRHLKVCYLRVSQIKRMAQKFTASVQDTSWITALDSRAQLAYRRTAQDTVNRLVGIFENVESGNNVAKEFGELLVSMGASRALEVLFEHISVPISEIWKPQLSGNEGFDFHTECSTPLINFGEAKFNSSASAYRAAINQASDFFEQEKHFRDLVHLVNLLSEQANQNLENERYGVIAAFSITSNDPVETLNRAIEALDDYKFIGKASAIYLVGVIL